MSAMLRMRRQLPKRGDPVAALLAQYTAQGKSALYIPDFNPNRVAASGLGRLRTLPGPAVAVTTIADPIGVVLGESEGAALGAEMVAAGDGDGTSIVNWTGNDAQALISLVTGTFKIENGDGSVGVGGLTFTAVVGATYRFTADVIELSGPANALIAPVGATILGGATTANLGTVGTERTVFVVATATTMSLRVGPNTATMGHFVRVDNLSVKRVSGSHAGQLTAAARGTLRAGNADARYVWRGDGTDDNLLSTLAPAAAFTMMAGVEFDAVSDKCIGASVGANLFSLGTDASGLATAYVGSSVIALSAADVRDIPGVIAISVSGTSYYGFWKPFTGVAEVVSGTFAGSIPTTRNISIGAENDDGTAVAFHAGDNYFDFAVAAQLTASEMYEVARRASGPFG